MGNRDWVALLPTSSERIALMPSQAPMTSKNWLQELEAGFAGLGALIYRAGVIGGLDAEQLLADLGSETLQFAQEVEVALKGAGTDLEKFASEFESATVNAATTIEKDAGSAFKRAFGWI